MLSFFFGFSCRSRHPFRNVLPVLRAREAETPSFCGWQPTPKTWRCLLVLLPMMISMLFDKFDGRSTLVSSLRSTKPKERSKALSIQNGKEVSRVNLGEMLAECLRSLWCRSSVCVRLTGPIKMEVERLRHGICCNQDVDMQRAEILPGGRAVHTQDTQVLRSRISNSIVSLKYQDRNGVRKVKQRGWWHVKRLAAHSVTFSL